MKKILNSLMVLAFVVSLSSCIYTGPNDASTTTADSTKVTSDTSLVLGDSLRLASDSLVIKDSVKK